MIDHEIESLPEVKSHAKDTYCMMPLELTELQKQLEELLSTRFIKPIKAPYGASVLSLKKKDKSLRLCIDCRTLNKLTVRHNYPLSIVTDLFDR